MKKLIIMLCLGLLMVACDKKEEPKPGGLLDKAIKAVAEKTDETKAAAEKAQAEAEKKAAEAKAEAEKKAAEAKAAAEKKAAEATK